MIYDLRGPDFRLILNFRIDVCSVHVELNTTVFVLENSDEVVITYHSDGGGLMKRFKPNGEEIYKNRIPAGHVSYVYVGV